MLYNIDNFKKMIYSIAWIIFGEDSKMLQNKIEFSPFKLELHSFSQRLNLDYNSDFEFPSF